MKEFLKLIVVCSLSWLIFVLLTNVHFDGLLPLDHTVAQALIFPLVIILFSRVEICGLRPSRSMLVVGSAMAFLGFAYAFTSPTRFGKGGLLIARFNGDELQTTTRIFREHVNSFISRDANLSAHSYLEGFTSYKEVKDFLEEHSKISFLTWGNARWINIAFREENPTKLSELGLSTSFAALSELQIVNSVPISGMSFQPERDSARFVASLAMGLKNTSPDIAPEIRELSLFYAATIVAPWTSFAHRSYAWWQLGNLRLERSIENHTIDKRALDCAIASYEKALIFLRKTESPELQSAIRSNLGVALYIRAVFDGRKGLRDKALRSMMKSIHLLHVKNSTGAPYSAGLIALENVSLISGHKFNAVDDKISRHKLKKHKRKRKKV